MSDVMDSTVNCLTIAPPPVVAFSDIGWYDQDTPCTVWWIWRESNPQGVGWKVAPCTKPDPHSGFRRGGADRNRTGV